MNRRRSALPATLLLAASALLASCSADTVPTAPGPFETPDTVFPAPQPGTGNDTESIDPGIAVPMDPEGMSVTTVDPIEEPVPMPTIDVSGTTVTGVADSGDDVSVVGGGGRAAQVAAAGAGVPGAGPLL